MEDLESFFRFEFREGAELPITCFSYYPSGKFGNSSVSHIHADASLKLILENSALPPKFQYLKGIFHIKELEKPDELTFKMLSMTI